MSNSSFLRGGLMLLLALGFLLFLFMFMPRCGAATLPRETGAAVEARRGDVLLRGDVVEAWSLR